jgi:hypothetical protein
MQSGDPHVHAHLVIHWRDSLAERHIVWNYSAAVCMKRRLREVIALIMHEEVMVVYNRFTAHV